MSKLLVISSLVVALVGGIGAGASGRWAPAWGGGVLAFSAGVNLGASWLAFVPIALVRRKRREYLAQAVMGASAARLLTVALATLAAMNYGPWPMAPLSTWMLVFYLSLLAVETGLTVRLLSRDSGAARGSAST